MSDKFEQVNSNKNTSFKKVKTTKDKNIYAEKVPCPACGSMHTSAISPATQVWAFGASCSFVCLIACSWCLWIPILEWMLLVPFGMGILIGLFIMFIGIILTLFVKN